MYPLNGQPIPEYVVARTAHAESVDNVVVANSTESPDNVIEQYAPIFGADVIRGSELDILSRFERAVKDYDPEIILRVTGDCPLIAPEFIGVSNKQIQADDVGHSSTWASNRQLNIFEYRPSVHDQ